MTKPTITAVILTKNNQALIENCLRTVKWCDEILVVDSGSIDQTQTLAKKMGAKIVNTPQKSFAEKRNEALKQIKTDWVFYLDTDERVSPALAKEIETYLFDNRATALSLKRNNICYGYQLTFGGWQHDQVTRVFKLAEFRGWQGKIHESPVFDGSAVLLKEPLLHLTHQNTQSNLKKSADWTPIEAQLLFESGAKKVGFVTLLRKGCLEFCRRAFWQKGYRDGLAGLIEALVQGINRMLVYIQVWELQQKPSLAERYQQQEAKIKQQWQQVNSKK